MTKNTYWQLAIRGVIVGLTTSGVIIGFHFLGASLADDSLAYSGVLKYAMPVIIGMLWFLPAVLWATRNLKEFQQGGRRK